MTPNEKYAPETDDDAEPTPVMMVSYNYISEKQGFTNIPIFL